ncbi:RNA-binding protein 4B-like isoform X1 [Pelobates fuscus]|uniref:RNA-binding protein 4B-like isoform X1 n=1 Tax=Pelobates fuscus TaxID=191477 RepID=UPI002FE4E61A
MRTHHREIPKLYSYIMVKIFVGGVSPSASPEELKKLFERYGQVNECDILKNYAFVHMEREQDAHRAIGELHKQEFYGSHLTVEYATSKIRNATKIYVGNVSSRATTSQVKELFEKFGKVVECDIVKNYAFVHMAKEREAMDAILHLNDTPLADQKIFVTLSKSNNAPKSSKMASAIVAASSPAPPPPPPPPPPAYYFHRGRLPPPPTPFSPYAPRSWYEREYYERYTYDFYDRSTLGARAAYDRALAPAAVMAAAAAALPTAPVAPAPPTPASLSAALAPAAYRDRSPVGRRTAAAAAAVMAQYADPYGASQAYSQTYSQAYASAFSQYSMGAAAYSPAEYYEKYANGYAGQYSQTY